MRAQTGRETRPLSKFPRCRRGAAGAASLRGRLRVTQSVAVQRREQQVTHADVELHWLEIRRATRRRSERFFGDQRAHQAPTKISQREALGVALDHLGVFGPTTKSTRVLSGVCRSTVSDVMRARDHGKAEEARPDDNAQRLKTTDASPIRRTNRRCEWTRARREVAQPYNPSPLFLTEPRARTSQTQDRWFFSGPMRLDLQYLHRDRQSIVLGEQQTRRVERENRGE